MLGQVNIIYKDIKNLKISLTKDCTIQVSSPIGIARKDIFELLQKKRTWIEKQRRNILANKKYDYTRYSLNAGDKIYFLGRKYLIKIKKSQQNLINEHDSYLEFLLNTSVIDNRNFKLELLEEFYKDKADIILNNLVSKYLKITNQQIHKVTIRKTKTRWGSCNHIKRTINLNFSIILRDIKVIEYVIIHEIAHLTHPNHSKEFYAYIAKYMPDWQDREKILKWD